MKPFHYEQEWKRLVGANELQGPDSAEHNREAIIAGGKGDEVWTP